MTDEQFKQIVREIQGKYFRKEYGDDNTYLRKIVKVRRNPRDTSPKSEWFEVFYNIIKLQHQPISEQKNYYHPCMNLKDFYKHFGERIKPFEYNSKLKNKHEHEHKRRD